MDDDELTPEEIEEQEDISPEEQAAFEAAFTEGFKQPHHENPGMADSHAFDETLGDETEEELEEMQRMRDVASASAGEEDTTPPTDDSEASDDASDAAGADAFETMRQQMEQLATRVRRSEGHLGNLQETIRSISDTAARATQEAGGDVPTQAQMNAAWKDSEKFQAMREEFPEFAELFETVFDMALPAAAAPGAQQDPQQATPQTAQAVMEAAKQAVREELIADAHPDWEDVVATEEFAAWLKTQPEDMQARAGSDRPMDAITVLDEFQPFREFVQGLDEVTQESHTAAGLLALYKEAGVESAATQESNDPPPQPKPRRLSRLKGSVPATRPGRGTTTVPASQSASEQAAFESGFKNSR